ncbi:MULTISPECIES: methionine ABC transporter ATP-binding protein [Olivibacter]|jgi:D-methionine transport system ATP-binding protein|uniref:Methionine ABC transporter ATP-binding protein n=1 Tax=Olivibacter oleidegradans TaxID=760123 RepID=A0ABV6HP17_9SPHI|nr:MULTISPECIES: methionine ABC transporter ATP-binding protein [Olivibacter]MDM8173348.1 methionine ABC transporter ATP-binding protein [Olivibacter sp. 47]MDX3915215.1 methionine ABC transporter ATP-binding protein [Pseudosphingobacterium sp.]QEL03123.1 methionine ABC transporter ATP-binding protein [Olivibacter sp. LS-1]
MIELKDISKVFRKKNIDIKALTEVNLKIPEGRIYGIIGSSGAGKSTLIRCINLLERPTQGQVLINDVDLMTLSPGKLIDVRRKIGMIFQHFNLLSSRTVFENIAFPLELIGTSKEHIQLKVKELLDLVGLESKSDEYPASLSGGQKQRVAIARALASDPAVLLCDEATSALDPATTRSILNLLKDINKRLNITIVLITHEMDVVKAICDDVAVLSEGRVIERGSVREIFSNAKTDLTQQFINSSLHVDIAHEYLNRLVQVSEDNGKDLLLKVRFNGASTDQPLLSSIVKLFGIDYEVLNAKMDTLGDMQVGVMLLKISGSIDAITNVINYFKDKKLEVEVIGYV